MTEMMLCGYEIISLANKVIDYNERYSAEGTNDDEYSPITLTVYSDDNNWYALGYGAIEIYIDGKNYEFGDDVKPILFTESYYTVSSTTHTLEELFEEALKIVADSGNNSVGTEDAAVDIVKSLSSIALSEDQLNYNKSRYSMSYEESYMVAIQDYNSLTDGQKFSVSTSVTSTYEEMIEYLFSDDYILNYYEYYQFKKGIFKCTKIEYDDTYGRVSEIDFTFTGDIE